MSIFLLATRHNVACVVWLIVIICRRADRVQLEKSLEELRGTAHLLRPDPNGAWPQNVIMFVRFLCLLNYTDMIILDGHLSPGNVDKNFASYDSKQHF